MLRIRKGYMLRKIVDEWVVVSIGRETSRPQTFMMLNETGAWLWEMMQAGAEQAAMAEALADTYGVDRQQANADTAVFVRNLLDNGIAERYGEGKLA